MELFFPLFQMFVVHRCVILGERVIEKEQKRLEIEKKCELNF